MASYSDDTEITLGTGKLLGLFFLLVMVCGGLGSLHAMAMHSFGPTRAATRAF